MRQKLLFVFGTRPETIKMFPVIRLARERDDLFDVRVCVTAQHRQMLDQFVDLFGICIDADLNIMRPDQTLSGVAAQIFERLDPVLSDERPDWVLVQGDTTTAMVAALAAFHRGVRAGHVEAGLRTFDLASPFPEEMNRQVTSRVSSLHFAPTPRARENLLRENIPADRIVVTGNTVIDTLFYVRDHLLSRVDLAARLTGVDFGKRLVLITGHRRESFGDGFVHLCGAIRELLESHEEIVAVFPVHMNPNVRGPVHELLGPATATGRLHLIEPLDYLTFVALMNASYLVLTDSGGVQEEAPSLGKPVLCTRFVTERPEGVEAGTVRLVGTNRQLIVEAVEELLFDPTAYARMAGAKNPYGDGHASERILNALSASD